MVKLCRSCGYINRDDALECEECHSLFDSELNTRINGDNQEISDEDILSSSRILSIEDILKTNNEDVIDNQKQYVADDNSVDNNTYETVNEDINEIDDTSNENSQYVQDFLYSKNGESDYFDIDENQIVANNDQEDEIIEENNNMDDVSSFLYGGKQDDKIYNLNETLDINNNFDQSSISDVLSETNQDTTAENEIEEQHTETLADDFDATAAVTDFLYDNYHKNEVEDNTQTEEKSDDYFVSSEIEVNPIDIIYDNNNESKSVSDFLYNVENNNTEKVTFENLADDNNVLEEYYVEAPDNISNDAVIIPADSEETLESASEEPADNNNEEEYVVDETRTIESNEIIQETIDAEDSTSTLNNEFEEVSINEENTHNDESVDDELNDTLSDDVLEGEAIPTTPINEDDLLDEEAIIDQVNKELEDAAYMQNLGIDNILNYGNTEETATLDTVENVDNTTENAIDNTIDTIDSTIDNTEEIESTKTGLLDTLKQIFSFTSTNSKELSKKELQEELNEESFDNTPNQVEQNVIEQKDTESQTYDTTADAISIPTNIKATKGFSNIKPMEIRRKVVDKVTTTSADDIEDALKVFESAGTIKKEEKAPETVVYDLPANDIVIDEKILNDSAIPKKDLPKKRKTIIKGKTKAVSKNQSIIRRSIALSAAVACIIITIVVVSRVNREKELNAYCARLAANNDISYTNLYNGLLEKGYSEDESFKAIESLGIDFADNALNVIYSISEDSNKLSSKDEVRNILINKGFANSEIDKAMSIVDWSKYLNTFITACIAKTKELDKNTIIRTIEEAKFTTTEVEYVKRNSDWTKLAKKNLSSFLDGEELHTKTEAKDYLVEKGYSEQDIEETFKVYEWDSYAYQYLTKYLKQQEEEGKAIDSSRITYTKILEDAEFDETEIELVIGRFDFASYAKSKIDTTISEGSDFVDKNKVKEALEKEGYTEEEIASALKETDWNAAAISSLKALDNRKLSKKDMIQKLIDAGYSDAEIAHVNKNYDWANQAKSYLSLLRSQKQTGSEDYLKGILKEQSYSDDEINALLGSVDQLNNYFTNAIKEDLNDIMDSSKISRAKATKELSDLHYNSVDIKSALNTIKESEWKEKASEYIASININSRAEARKTLKNEDFTVDEINYAINNSGINWSTVCIDYAKTIFNQNDNATKKHDCELHTNDEKTSIERTLEDAEFTSDEINKAIASVFTTSACKIN